MYGLIPLLRGDPSQAAGHYRLLMMMIQNVFFLYHHFDSRSYVRFRSRVNNCIIYCSLSVVCNNMTYVSIYHNEKFIKLYKYLKVFYRISAIITNLLIFNKLVL